MRNTAHDTNHTIIIAGGGTGGHIFPAIAIANALRRLYPQINILFVGAKGKMEMEKVPQAGYAIEGLDIAGFNRSALLKNIGLPFKLIKSFFQVRRIIRSVKPVAVIGVGGYSSFPVLRYAQSGGIPTFIHESNSFAGKSNILLGKKATRIFVAAKGMEKFFPAEKIQITGNPVRETIAHHTVSREEGLRFFGLGTDKTTILSIGGSLGALSINEALEKDYPRIVEAGYQLIWQTGKPFLDRGKKAVAANPQVWVNDFITQMEYAYAAADIVISRSGAMAIAELCVVQKPVVFVPFPYAAEDHQSVNARQLVEQSAGLMIPDAEAREKLVTTIVQLAGDVPKQALLKKNIARLGVTDADVVIARAILKHLSIQVA
jgi:UDP-N-acetylglucosamine--N-acetylmuramyl-(pentapeptide) pyrophosphoryl-undecaprenol N-acetylglucosamine transferase